MILIVILVNSSYSCAHNLIRLARDLAFVGVRAPIGQWGSQSAGSGGLDVRQPPAIVRSVHRNAAVPLKITDRSHY